MTPWTTGVGGSEQAAVEWSEGLAKLGYEVVSGVPLPDGRDDEWEAGVHWHSVLKQSNVDDILALPLVINFRNPQLYEREKPSGACWWYVAQDTDYGGYMKDEVLAKIDRYLCLCKAHAAYTLQKYPILTGKVYISSNGVRAQYIKELEADCTRVRNPYQMFYASSPDRGLKTLLQLWPRIKERIPEAKLRVAYGFNNMLVLEGWHQANGETSWHTAYRQDLERLLNQKDVEFIGRQPVRKVYEEWFQARLFPYPNNFSETSCCSIMEAMSCGAFPVVNDRWAVGEHAKLLQPYPYLVDGEPGDSELARHLWLSALYSALENPPSEADRRALMDDARDTYDWARIFTMQLQPWLEEDFARE